jgi:hypothetical protein
MEGTFSVMCQADASGPMRALHGLGVIGCDPLRKRYTWDVFHSDGVTTGSPMGKGPSSVSLRMARARIQIWRP